MATWDDVRRIVATLPDTAERTAADGRLEWRAHNKPLTFERPLRRADLEALGDAAPDGPILGVMVADVGVVQALLADDPAVYFITPHFAGYPAVLLRLGTITPDELNDLLVDAWLARVPKRTAKAYLDAHP